MRKRGRVKYFIVVIIWFLIFAYGFIKININKPELVKNKSKFTISFKLKPVDFRIETKEYIFYINNDIIHDIKQKCINVYNGVFSK